MVGLLPLFLSLSSAEISPYLALTKKTEFIKVDDISSTYYHIIKRERKKEQINVAILVLAVFASN